MQAVESRMRAMIITSGPQRITRPTWRGRSRSGMFAGFGDVSWRLAVDCGLAGRIEAVTTAPPSGATQDPGPVAVDFRKGTGS